LDVERGSNEYWVDVVVLTVKEDRVVHVLLGGVSDV
jgi:hypothetical protein